MCDRVTEALMCICSVQDCAFTYKNDVTINGTFTSPNFPGLYPRNVQCHYLFYGADKSRVYITFLSFDVDGIPPRYAWLICFARYHNSL